MSNMMPSAAFPPNAVRPPSQMVNDYFVCVICMEKLNDPRMCRTCSKMWCRSCIEEWMRHGQRNCPHCRRQLNSEDIVKCRWVEDLMRVIEGTMRQPSASAIVIGGGSANSSASSSSSAALTSSGDGTSLLAAADSCALHREVVSIYCRTCKSCICYRCAVFGEHKTHSFKPLEEVHEERVKLLRGKLGGVKKRLIDVTQLLDGVERNQIHLRTARDERLSETRQALERIETGFERELAEKTAILRNHAGRLDREARCLRSLVRTTDELISQYSKRQAIEKADEWIKELEMAQLPSMRQFRVPYIQPAFPSPIFPAYDSATFTIGNFRLARTDGRPLFSDPLTIRGVVWRLKVYPDGNGLVRSTHVSVFLELHGGSVTQRNRYEYRIELCHQGRLDDGSDADVRLNYSRDCTSEFEINDSWGYNRFFELERIEREGYWHASSDTVKFRFYIRSPTYALKCEDLERYVRDIELANERLQRTNRRMQVDMELVKNSQRFSSIVHQQQQQLEQQQPSRRTSVLLSSTRRSSAVIPQKADAGDPVNQQLMPNEQRMNCRIRNNGHPVADGDIEASEIMMMMENITSSNSNSLDSIASMLLASDEQHHSSTNREAPKTAPPRRRRLPAPSSSAGNRLGLQDFVLVDGQRRGDVAASRYRSGPVGMSPDEETPAMPVARQGTNVMHESLLERLPFLTNNVPQGTVATSSIGRSSAHVLPWEFLSTTAGGISDAEWLMYGLPEQHPEQSQQQIFRNGSDQFDAQHPEMQASLDFLTATLTTPRMMNSAAVNAVSRERSAPDDLPATHPSETVVEGNFGDDDEQHYVDYAVEQLLMSPPITSQNQRKSYNYDDANLPTDGSITSSNMSGAGPSQSSEFVRLRERFGSANLPSFYRPPVPPVPMTTETPASIVAAVPVSPPTRRSISMVPSSALAAATPVAATHAVSSEQTDSGNQESDSNRDADNDDAGTLVRSVDSDTETGLNTTFSLPSNDNSLPYVENESVMEGGSASSGGGAVRNWCDSLKVSQAHVILATPHAANNADQNSVVDGTRNVSLLADEVLLSSFADGDTSAVTDVIESDASPNQPAVRRANASSVTAENVDNTDDAENFHFEHSSATRTENAVISMAGTNSNDDVEVDDDDSSTLADDNSDDTDDVGVENNTGANSSISCPDFTVANSAATSKTNTDDAGSSYDIRRKSCVADTDGVRQKSDLQLSANSGSGSLALSRVQQPSLLRKPGSLSPRTPFGTRIAGKGGDNKNDKQQ